MALRIELKMPNHKLVVHRVSWGCLYAVTLARAY
jgi:hypothetical protein